jgi:selenocysteine-specific elongation factor
LPSPEAGNRPHLLASWISGAGLSGLTPDAMAGRLGVLEEAVQAPLGRLLEGGDVVALSTQPATLVATGEVGQLAQAATEALAQRLAGEEVSAGIPARDFMGQLLPPPARRLADVYLEELRRRGVLELADGRVVPPGQDSHMTAAGAELTRRVEAVYRDLGFQAPSPQIVAEQLTARPASVEGICRYLVQRRRLVRLDGKFLVHRAVLDDVADRVRGWDVDDFSVGDFKNRFGLTRKLAIPTLEWLDSERVTVRQGDRRRIVRRRSS